MNEYPIVPNIHRRETFSFGNNDSIPKNCCNKTIHYAKSVLATIQRSKTRKNDTLDQLNSQLYQVAKKKFKYTPTLNTLKKFLKDESYWSNKCAHKDFIKYHFNTIPEYTFILPKSVPNYKSLDMKDIHPDLSDEGKHISFLYRLNKIIKDITSSDTLVAKNFRFYAITILTAQKLKIINIYENLDSYKEKDYLNLTIKTFRKALDTDDTEIVNALIASFNDLIREAIPRKELGTVNALVKEAIKNNELEIVNELKASVNDLIKEAIIWEDLGIDNALVKEVIKNNKLEFVNTLIEDAIKKNELEIVNTLIEDAIKKNEPEIVIALIAGVNYFIEEAITWDDLGTVNKLVKETIKNNEKAFDYVNNDYKIFISINHYGLPKINLEAINFIIQLINANPNVFKKLEEKEKKVIIQLIDPKNKDSGLPENVKKYKNMISQNVQKRLLQSI